MDNATVIIRGWRECPAGDNAMEEGNRQGYSRVIEKYLMAAEKRGWESRVEAATGVELKSYLKDEGSGRAVERPAPRQMLFLPPGE